MVFGMKSADVILSPYLSPYLPQHNKLYINRLSRFGDRVTDIFTKIWFCVNLGGNGLLQSLTNYLIIKALVNEIKLQMCVFFRIFVCEFKSEKAPICMVQRYEEIWTYASNRPDKISRD